MTRNTMAPVVIVASVLLAGTLLAGSAAAAPGDVVASFPVVATAFAANPTSNVVYVATTGDNSVAAINMNTLELVGSVFVGSGPSAMAVSRDGTRLYVALAGASQLGVIDLGSFSVLEPIPLPVPCADVAVGYDETIFVAPTSSNNRAVYRIDRGSGAARDALGGMSCSACRRAMLETSPDGETLFIANRGLSPGTLAKYDISGPEALFVWQNGHGDLGSNGQDLWVAPTGEHAYYAVGGGNRVAFGYDIAQIDANSMGVNGAIGTGAYPREVTTSPDGDTIYAVHTSGHIDVWDGDTFIQIDEYPTAGEAVELFVDKTGDSLLAAFPLELRIYEAEGSEPLVDIDGDGIDDGADNCVGYNNPNQEDVDGDGLGDPCDSYPNEANNEFAACQEDLAESVTACRDGAAILEAEITTLTDRIAELEAELADHVGDGDEDGDGVLDSQDQCPGTPASFWVSRRGCSIRQMFKMRRRW